MLVKITKPVYEKNRIILAPNQVVQVEVELANEFIVMPTNGTIRARRVEKRCCAKLSDMQEALYA